jgi:prophage tail gpP-like protein
MLEVFYKDNKYDLFESIHVKRSLDSICGTFTLKTTLSTNIPFGRRSFITIKADGVIVMSGFIEKMDGSITSTTETITFSGRDLLGDLVDSSLPVDVSVTEGDISFPSLCTKVIDALGIKSKVRNLAGSLKPFDSEDVISTEFGGKAGEYLQSFARKRQVYLTSYGNGFLIIFSPPKSVAYSQKLTKDSLLSRSFTYSDIARYNKVVVGSEANFVTDEDVDLTDDTDRRSEATDKDVRSTRQLFITAEETMTDEEIESRAQEEINIRRGQAFKYSCTVPSHEYTIGTLVSVEDELSGVSGSFLIKEVEYSQSSAGLISTLTLCFPETYTGIAKRTTQNRSQLGFRPIGSSVGGLFGQNVEAPLRT